MEILGQKANLSIKINIATCIIIIISVSLNVKSVISGSFTLRFTVVIDEDQ